jgi:hypothetical protein
MHSSIRLLLLLAMVSAAAALMAPTALGQLAENHETLEVTDEHTGLHCPAIAIGNEITGGCLGHGASEGPVQLRKHVFGVESNITSCNNEGWGRGNEDGEGYGVFGTLTGAGCTRQPCKDANGDILPWPAHADEGHTGIDGETGVPAGEIGTTVFCIEPVGGGADESCEISAPGNETAPGSHIAESGDGVEIPGHGFGGFRCELVGHWRSESGGHYENNPANELEDEGEVVHIAAENKVEVP